MYADLDAAPAARGRHWLTLQAVAEAWNEATGDAIGPQRVVPIRPARWSEPGHHLYVFEIEGSRDAPAAVAMLGSAARVEFERVVYEAVLSRTSLSRLRYYGWLPHSTPGLAWQFVEFVEPRSFRRDDPSHAAALASWLGHLHAIGREVVSLPELPDRGVDVHRAHLATAITALGAAGDDGDYADAVQREQIEHLASALDDVERRWDRNDARLRELPHGFIHGDLKPDNVGCVTQPELRVVAYDWEYAGWGPLAVDIGTTMVHTDVAARYLRTLRAEWPDLRAADVEYMGRVGEILRAVMAIRWLVDAIPLKPAHKVLRGIDAQVAVIGARLAELSW
jgi:aminoglycoside phosphotransferase (APT) family kinase protein